MQEDNNKKGLIPEILGGRYWTAFFWSSILVMFFLSYKAWFFYAAICGALFALNKAQYIKTNHKLLGAALGAVSGLITFLFGGRQSANQEEVNGESYAEMQCRKVNENTEIIVSEHGFEYNEHYTPPNDNS